jgi:hypothetical protein
MKWMNWTLPLFFLGISLSLSLRLTRAVAEDSEDFELKKNSIISQPAEVIIENIIVEDLKPLGSIIGSYKKQRYLTNMDAVYLKLKTSSVSVGDRFMVYNDLGGVKVPGAFFKRTGKNIEIKGYLQVSEVTPSAVIAKIYDSNIDINIGDLLGPMMDDLIVKVAPQEPTVTLSGKILASAKDTKFVGPYEFAYIDKGKADGLRVNDRLFVYRTGDGSQSVTKDLPQVNVAELTVAHLSEHHATVYCLGSSESFEMGSDFKTARTEVRYLK